jgi:hypothetical protein
MIKKIGLDFHGVISAAPDKFSIFCSEIRKSGIKVYIISGGPKQDIAQYLAKNNIEYDEIWAIMDYYKELHLAQCYDDGSFQVPTEIWNTAKAKYCAENNINFHIDDSPIYGLYFTTPYCEYNIQKGYCSVDSMKKINFNRPKEAAKDIAKIISESD